MAGRKPLNPLSTRDGLARVVIVGIPDPTEDDPNRLNLIAYSYNVNDDPLRVAEMIAAMMPNAVSAATNAMRVIGEQVVAHEVERARREERAKASAVNVRSRIHTAAGLVSVGRG
jgi:hypothetical protein